MLGFDALGRFALGQVSGVTTTALVADQGSFALNGQAVTFKTAELVVNGAFTLSGQAVTFKASEIVVNGSFAITGQAATFETFLGNAVFAIDGAVSGFSGGTYNQSLLRTGLTVGSLAATIAGSATNSLWAITNSGEPGVTQATTNYSAALNVTAGNANIFGSVQFIRTDSIGVFQSQSSITPEQALTTGTITFSLGSVNLGTWGATDRLLVVVFLRNNVGSSQNVTIGLGSLTGSNATYGGAAYALSGQAATFKTIEAVSFGSYSLTGFPALYSIDFNKDSQGSSISGGTFSRGRWRKLLEEEEREREAERRRIETEKLRKRAEKRRRELALADARRAAREAEAARGQATSNALALAHSEAAARGVDAIKQSLAQSELLARHARMAAHREAMERDDEEAILLLMSHHHGA